MSTAAPFGTWTSPIQAELLSSKTPSYSDCRSIDGQNYWVESRPWETGRSVVVQESRQHVKRDLIPQGFSARSRVHEYGGSCWAIHKETLYFVNDRDQRIYAVDIHAESLRPVALTASGNWRFGDLIVDCIRHRLIAVGEYHSTPQNIQNLIVTVSLPEGEIQPLVEGDDFYAYPRLSPSGEKLCWLSWNHPNLPWNGTQLWVSKLNGSGKIDSARRISGGENESIFQPQWSPDDRLYFVSDRDNWWNIYRQEAGHDEKQITHLKAEVGLPLWQLGMSTYGFLNDQRILFCYCDQGIWQLASVNTQTTKITPIQTPYTAISQIFAETEQALFIAASKTHAPEVIQYNPYRNLFKASTPHSGMVALQPYISQPRAVTFPTTHGDMAHGFYYPPCNPDFAAPENSKPPMIVLCHGGPTSATSPALNLKIQFWTSRGFAVFDVNYRGSSGYGRDYRQKLHHQWGILDAEDACHAAKFAVEAGWADPDRLIIRGSSAGGYTVLCALTFHSVFSAGCSYYGIGDLEVLAQDTHKFESRYGDFLVGPYPESKTLYQDRSPIHHIDQLDCPVIFFQGLLDKVVPPNQSAMMVEALREKGIRVSHITYPNEGHGFRSADAQRHSLHTELAFYGALFKFKTDSLNPNLLGLADWSS